MDVQALKEQHARLAQDSCVPWDAYEGARVLITGATGLVGFNVAAALLLNGTACEQPPVVYALVRNVDAAKKRYEALGDFRGRLVFVPGDVTKVIECPVSPDYVIHAAARTDSAGMVNEPLSVIGTTLYGIRNVLDFATANDVKNTVYVSSMEVYGAYESESLLGEHDYGVVDPLSIRSSYPESKKMAENICCSYASERATRVCIARLAQCFGPGLPANENRVFAYFMRCAKEGRDIELATDGLSTRMYVAAADAAAALLVLAARGESGTAYNVANPKTYCSIREMATLVCDNVAHGGVEVRTMAQDAGKYPPNHHLRLDTGRIQALGWRPVISLSEMFESIAGEI